jgi:hypothetical protein
MLMEELYLSFTIFMIVIILNCTCALEAYKASSFYDNRDTPMTPYNHDSRPYTLDHFKKHTKFKQNFLCNIYLYIIHYAYP